MNNLLTTNYPKHQAVAQHPRDHNQEEGHGQEDVKIAPGDCVPGSKDS